MEQDVDLKSYLAKKQADAPAPSDDVDLKKYLEKKSDRPSAPLPEQSYLQKGLGYLGEKYDSYVTAPARAGVSKLQDGDVPGSVAAWWDQVGKDPKTAPTGKDIALKMGMSDEKINKPAWLEQYESKVQEQSPEYFQNLKAQYPNVGEKGKLGGSPADLGGQFYNAAIDPALLTPGKVFKGLASGAGKVGEGLVNATKGLEETKLGTNMLEASPQMFEHTPKANVEEIKAAAGRLGVEPTPGMLTSNKNLQKMENVLSKSPTVAGHLTQKKYTPIFKAIDESIAKIGDVSSLTPSEAGNEAKRQLMGKIAERLDPLRASYENIRESTRAAPIDEKMAGQAAERLSKQPIAKGVGTEGNQIISKYSKMLSEARDAETVQNIISDAKGALREARGPAKIALAKSIDQGEKLLRRGLLTSATSGAGQAGKLQAKGLINQIKDTNKGFRELSQELGAATDSTSVRSTSPSDILNQVDSLRPEKFGSDLFDVKNIESLKALQKLSPETFEVARQQRLSHLLESATVKGQISPQRLITAVKKIPKDVQQLLFSKGVPENIKDIETMLNATPDLVNPSGTSTAMSWAHTFDPRNIPQQGSDYLKYRKLQNQSLVPSIPAAPVSKGILRAGKLGQVSGDQNAK